MEIYWSVGDYLILMKLHEKSEHDMNRKGIVNVNNATYKTDRALVCQIIHKSEKNIGMIDEIFDNEGRIYRVGEYLLDDMNIKFFLSREAAMNYKNIPKNGTHNIYDVDGNLFASCDYVDGKKEGKLIFYYPKSTVIDRVIEMKCDILNGTTKHFYKEVGHYVNGTLNGKKIIYYQHGTKNNEDEYIDGLKNGVCIEYDEDEQIIAMDNMKMGVKNGICEAYHYNGMLMETGHWDEGKKTGIHKMWGIDDNGEHVLTYIGEWKDGKEVGVHKYWDDEGNFMYETKYD